jgi:hypothetical protein
MSTTSPRALPNVAEILAPILGRVAPGHRPLLVAIAERMAADRYRRWADDTGDAGVRDSLLACAAREEEIAARVEALYPDAGRIQREILADQPDLAGVDRSVFATRPLREQFAIQAQGERVGASTWRAFAAREDDAARRAVFLACAPLEEASAAVLEAILRTAS